MTLVTCTIPCNLCGSDTAERVGTIDRDGQPLRTVLCQSCGLVWTDPRPGRDETRKFYSKDYRLQYKSTYIPKRKHVYRETLRAIARYQEVSTILLPRMKLLDVGCGGGFFPYVASQQGVDAQGVEPNEGFAKYSADTFDVPTTNAFLQDVEFDDESFEFITLNHVLEHVEDPCAILEQLRQWLAFDGYLVVEVPNVEATYHAPQNRYHVGHLYNFSPAVLERLGEKADLSVFGSKLVTGVDHIHVTFRKSRIAIHDPGDYTLPSNYQRIAKILTSHTPLRHYASPVPYTRFVGKQLQYLNENRAVRGEDAPREIADRLIAAHLGTPARRAA
ncbi:MAG: class I SAM-dependent methyltransferase [Planctomycetota bacterium]